MKNHFKTVCDHIRQASEDIGYGMILPAANPNRRAVESAYQLTGLVMMAGGLALNNTVVAGMGACLVGSSIAEYQNRGEAIRTALDAPQPQKF